MQLWRGDYKRMKCNLELKRTKWQKQSMPYGEEETPL